MGDDVANVRSGAKRAPRVRKTVTTTVTTVTEDVPAEKSMLIGICLDESGSMAGNVKDVIAGVNGMLNEHRDVKGDTFVTVVKFNYQSRPVQVNTPLGMYDGLHTSNYRPQGATALYQAITETINLMEESAHKVDKVVLAIQTDGYENASGPLYTRNFVKKMIERKREQGWTIVFLGQDIDAAGDGGEIGIYVANTVSFSADKLSKSMVDFGKTTKYMRTMDYEKKTSCGLIPDAAENYASTQSAAEEWEASNTEGSGTK